ncbi:PRC-barrel domain-containing protein [Phyllobacterium sp. K27]
MLRTLIASTAALGMLSGVAFAQGTSTPAPTTETMAPMKVETNPLFKNAAGTDAAPAETTAFTAVEEGELLASGLIGKNVYNGDADDAESIGKVADLIVGPDGSVKAAVIGVGGFLGIGAKNVALPADQLKLSVREDKNTWIVVETTKDKLNAAPAFEIGDNFTDGVADPMKANEAKNQSSGDTAPAAPAPMDTPATTTPAPAQ